MGSEGEDANVVRTAGSVLIGIGVFAFVVATLWNTREGEFDPESLVSVTATVVDFETKRVRTKTASRKWLVVDVLREIAGGTAPERWIVPTYSKKIEERFADLQVAEEATGLIASDPVLVRWNDTSVRILWDLSQRGETLVPRALVQKTEEDERYASPFIGVATIGLGLVLRVFSSLWIRRAAARPDTAR
jgi:hypothetical protein